MPVVLVFTKFDEIVTQVLRDMHGGNTQYALARTNAHQLYEDSCRRLFDKAPSEVPAGVVSGTFISHTPCGGPTDVTNHPQRIQASWIFSTAWST